MSMNPVPKPRRGPERPRPAPLPAATGAVDLAITEYRRRIALHDLIGYLLVVGGLGGLALLAAVIADHAWPGGLPRIALALIAVAWGLSLLAGVAATAALTVGRRLNPVFVAQQLERASRIRTNALVNTLLLRANPIGAYAADAVAGQAAHELETHPPARLVGVRTNRRSGVLLAAAAAAWLAYLGFAPKPVGPSLARVFGGGGAAPTATRLELVRPSPDEVVHAGDALTLLVAVHGQPVDRVELELRSEPDADLPSRTQTAYTRREDGDPPTARFSLAPLEVRDDLHYRLSAGDARLSGTIPVHPRPDLVNVDVVVAPPAYTGALPRAVDGPDVVALYGSTATFRLRANVEIRDPVFVLESDVPTRTRMRVDAADPRVATVERLLTESGHFAIEFADRWGYPHRDPPQRRITVRSDEPPTVEFTVPPRDAGDAVDVRRVPELLVTAEDDVGVTRLLLAVESASGRGAGAAEIALHEQTPGTARRVVRRIVTRELPIAPGETLRVWCVAEDGRTTLAGRPDFQTARTRTLTITYAEPEPQPAAPGDENGGSDDRQGADRDPGSRGDRGEEQQSGDSGRRPNGTGDQRDSTTRPGADAADGPSEGDEPGGSAPDEPDTSAGSNPDEAVEAGGATDGAERAPPADPQDSTENEPGGDSASPDGDSSDSTGDSSGDVDPSGGEPGTGGDSAAADSDAEFDRQVEEFVRRHGRDASEAAGGLRGDEQEPREDDTPGLTGGGAPTPGGGDTPSEPEPSGSPDTPSDPAGGDDAQASESGDSAREPPSPAGDPDSSPAEANEAGQPTEPPDADTESDASAGPKPESSSRSPDNADTPGTSPEPTAAPGGPPGERDRAVPDGSPSDADRHEPPEDRPASDAAAPEADPPPPAGETPPPSDLPPLDSQGLADTLDLLELLERGERIDEERLIELGWSRPRAAAFARALERLHDAARAAARGTPLRLHFDAELGNRERQRGAGMSADAGRNLDPAVARREGLERIAPPPEQDVPPALRDVLDAYYQSLAERHAEGGG